MRASKHFIRFLIIIILFKWRGTIHVSGATEDSVVDNKAKFNEIDE